MLFCDVSQGKSRNRLHMITLSFQLFGMENSKGAFVPTVFFQKLYFFFQLVSYFVHVSNSTPSFSGVDHFSRLLYDLAGRQAWSVISQAVFIRRLSEQAFLRFPVGTHSSKAAFSMVFDSAPRKCHC